MNRRYYVAPLSVVLEHRQLFHSIAGTQYQNLGGGLVLLNTCFSSQAAADIWHEHPEVAILPCPIYEGNDKLESHLAKATRKFKQEHMDALASIGVNANHNVFDVEAKASALNRGMRLRSIL